MEKLAILGGTPVIQQKPNPEIFKWPIMGQEDFDAAMEVIKANAFSGNAITEKFQAEYAEWLGVKHALCFCNGTMSLAVAMFAIGLGRGDEIICPTKTYWASIASAYSFGATPVFANINEDLVIDPNDIERCITKNTKAIMVVHYLAKPCDMDAIMAIAKKHNLKVIEDVSHAQGGLYKGRRLGTIGDVAGMSLMSTKSFAAGELGILITNDTKTYERAVAFGHYEKNNARYISQSKDLEPFFNIPLGGIKGRANQVCTALARVQLKYYDERCAEVRKAMNYFYDQLEGTPGLHLIRANEAEGSNMAGCYCPHLTYKSEELGGLSVARFSEALRAEAGEAGAGMGWPGSNHCLHTHNYFQTLDVFNEGKPTRISNSDYDVRETDEACKPSELIDCVSLPRFVKFDKDVIDLYVRVIKKVVENYESLLENDTDKSKGGHWYYAVKQ